MLPGGQNSTADATREAKIMPPLRRLSATVVAPPQLQPAVLLQFFSTTNARTNTEAIAAQMNGELLRIWEEVDLFDFNIFRNRTCC
jgi:hypothetical protein